MVICCVTGCHNRTSRKTEKQKQKESTRKISFHSFPEDPLLREAWLTAIRLDWTPNKSYICSEHFLENYLDMSTFYTKLLKSAVPTIFPKGYDIQPLNPTMNHPELLQLSIQPVEPSTSTSFEPLVNQTEKSSRAGWKRKYESLLRVSDAVRSSVSKSTSLSTERKRTRHMSPSRATTLIKNYKNNLSIYKKKIRSLQQKNRSQRKRTKNLRTVLKVLKFINEEVEKVLKNILGSNREMIKRHLNVCIKKIE